MGEKTILAQSMELAAEKAALDAVCKKLLANKSILARILKGCVEEFKDCSLADIEEKYIEGIPKVAMVAVHRDEAGIGGELVEGSANEDFSVTEGTVTYDVRFEALNPLAEREWITLIINIEAQNDFYPGYPLVKRGIYYGGRMISSQYGQVFTGSHYEKLKKVYSIWVCINPPKYRQNSINIYSFQERHIKGEVCEKRENYDLITVAMLCLGEEGDEECRGILRLLSVLFSSEVNVEDKKRILEEEFEIAMTRKMESEVREMCNYSDGVEQRGIEKGIEQGIEKGIEQGIEKGIEKGEMLKLIQLVCRKLEKGKMPEGIAEELDEDAAVVEKICTAVRTCGADAEIEQIYIAFCEEKQE